MLNYKLYRRITVVIGILISTIPNFLQAQGSPDIIWKKQHVTDRVNNIQFTPDGATLISGGSDRTINLWRVSDGALLQTLNTNAPFVHESAIEWMSLTADGSMLATCSYQYIQVWDLPSGRERKFEGHTDWVVGVGFTRDGSLLASAGFDGTVRIWRVSDGTTIKIIPIPGVQRCVAFSPDATLLAAASGDDNVYIYRTSDWSLVTTLTDHTEDLFTCAFSPDGTMLATGGYDDTVKLWNVSDWSLRFNFNGNGGNVYGLAFTHDSARIGYTDGEGHTIKIHRTSDGALLQTFTQETEHVQTVAFSKDGLLGYGRIDSTVVLARTAFSTTPPPSTLRITSPANGATFNAPANVTITAVPSKTDGSITKIEFFQSGTKLGEDLTAPFSFIWTNVPAGTYSLTVVETDNLGATISSAPTTVNVVNQTSAPPTISLTSPKTDARFNAPANITLTAVATADAGVANVEFFQNGISVGQDAASPFSLVWRSVEIGSYALTAVVTDKNGGTATSVPVNITVQTAPPETVRPRVVIAVPRAGARLTAPESLLSGTASDNVGVAEVLYSLNSAPFLPTLGTENWEVNLTLVPGLNVVQVKSVDISGNESAIASRSFTYVVSAALGVTVNGSGIVSLKDQQVLEVGKAYTVSARTIGDSVFGGWTGSFPTNKTSFSFVMAEGVSLIANFVPNPFGEVAGTYLGLIQSTVPSHEHSGFISINATRRGTFSGRISLGGKNYPINGKFNGDGSFSAVHSRTDMTLNLLLHLDDGSDQITGSITQGGFVSTLAANRLIYNARTNPAPGAGKYTILIPANTDEPNSPQGNGFGSLKVDASGKTRVMGSLADGTRFTQGAGISKETNWPFYVTLYRQSGSASGTIRFRDQPGVSDFDGPINWFRPANAAAKTFANGFSTQNELLGSTYGPTAPVLAVPPAVENVVVNLGEGDLESDLQKTATLETNNRFVVLDSDDEKLRISVSATSGTLNGSFIHPVTGRSTRYGGVVFQKQNVAKGFFLGAAKAGSVSVVPANSESAAPVDESPVLEEPPVVEEPSIVVEPEPTVPTEPAPEPRRKKRD